ncbi:uncharacterized protein LOC126685972 [Mercurialis annua]|uniref:uncharacterized protein LOC126685972 n=1 Tax=Mercurialis annua TaxID=3986 RepID=UPI0021609F5B|nr:uncharacterized protein LOC126685972 [Mercurialis annua]
MHPSGASNEDILRQEKTLLEEDKTYIKGFKFDHVWHIMKDFEKFNGTNQVLRNNQNVNKSVESQAQNPNYGTPASPGLSSFSIYLDASNAGGSLSTRPIGVKKAKSKRKMEEDSKESKLHKKCNCFWKKIDKLLTC